MIRKIGIGKVDAWEKPSTARTSKKKTETHGPFVNENAVLVIPAKSDAPDNGSGQKKRVAAYCRVSTKKDEQAMSYEGQKDYYRDYIERNPDWELAGIYADRLSGTDMENRNGLQRMIEDCKQGKIDFIITKSLERFSRNARQCLNAIDELLSLNPPVPIWFETDRINSAKDRYEAELHLGAFVAQHESVKKSRNIKWRWQLNFNSGIALMPTHCILGYDKDSNGNIVIVPKEAKVVRFIFHSYLDGKCVSEIAAELTKIGVPTVKGNRAWNPSVVRNMLRSEKYKGDAHMQKTYTPDRLPHKAIRNTGQVPMYYKKNHHPAIIPRNVWEEVQRQLELRRYQRPLKPKQVKKFTAKRVKVGMLQGYLVIKPSWNYTDTAAFLQMIDKERGNSSETV